MRLSREQYDAVADRAELLVSGAEMERVLDRLAGSITAVLAERDPLVLCVMNGAVIAVGRLLPRLGFPLTLDYVHATRYRGTTSGGGLQWLHRPAAAVRGRQVLVVDDVLDAGITLDAVVRGRAGRMGRPRCIPRSWWRRCVSTPVMSARISWACGSRIATYSAMAWIIWAISVMRTVSMRWPMKMSDGCYRRS